MKLTNKQLANINLVLNEISNQPLRGKFKFKIFKLRKVLRDVLEPVFELAQDTDNDEEFEEVLSIIQEVEIDEFTFEELEQIDLSLNQMELLEPIIKEETENV